MNNLKFQPLLVTLAVLLASALSGACQTQPVKPVTNPAPETHFYHILPPPFNAGTGFNFYETFTNFPPVMVLTNQSWNGTNEILLEVTFTNCQGRWFTVETTDVVNHLAAQYGTAVYTNAQCLPPNPGTTLGKSTITKVE